MVIDKGAAMGGQEMSTSSSSSANEEEEGLFNDRDASHIHTSHSQSIASVSSSPLATAVAQGAGDSEPDSGGHAPQDDDTLLPSRRTLVAEVVKKGLLNSSTTVNTSTTHPSGRGCQDGLTQYPDHSLEQSCPVTMDAVDLTWRPGGEERGGKVGGEESQEKVLNCAQLDWSRIQQASSPSPFQNKECTLLSYPPPPHPARERNDVHVAATAVTGAMSAEVKEMKAEIDLLKAEVLELRKDAAISSEMLQQAETRAKVGVSCQALLTSLHMIRTRGLWHALTLPSTHACTRRSRRRWRPPMRQV